MVQEVNQSDQVCPWNEEESEETALTRPRQPAVDPSDIKANKLFKIALDAENMGQRDAAKQFYKSLVSQYPKTQAARKATKRLKGL